MIQNEFFYLCFLFCVVLFYYYLQCLDNTVVINVLLAIVYIFSLKVYYTHVFGEVITRYRHCTSMLINNFNRQINRNFLNYVDL